MQSVRVITTAILISLFATAGWASERTYYRYVNESGVKVTLSGQLIERVPRQLTQAELQDRSSELAQERHKKEELRRLEEWDKSLMLRYSSTTDIEAAKKRTVSSVKVRISILKSNRQSVKSEIESEQARAANIERRGGDVPPELTSKIDVLLEEIKSIEDAIEVRQQEIEDLDKQFDRDIARFETLQERIELRSKARPVAKKKSYYY